METKSNFWLTRDGEEPSGPFTSEQLRSMWDLGQLTVKALAMRSGDPKEHWFPVEDMMRGAPGRKRNDRRGLFSGRVGLLVVVGGLIVLAWLNHGNEQTDPPQPYRKEIAEAKAWVKDQARDPRTVNFNEVSTGETDALRAVVLDFSWDNGFGGKSRKHWRFDFLNGGSGELQRVKDEDTGEVLAYGGAMLGLVRAQEEAEAKANAGKVDARVQQALDAAEGVRSPGMAQQRAVGTVVPSLPAVPGLGN